MMKIKCIEDIPEVGAFQTVQGAVHQQQLGQQVIDMDV